MAESSPDWNVSLVAWGSPSDPATSSGYAQGLARALSDHGRLRLQFSVKIIRPWDVCRGAVGLKVQDGYPRAFVRRGWMWSNRGHEVLSARLNWRIARAGDKGPFLQVGTLVRIDPSLGPHYMRTDMTIAQARRAMYFAISQLPKAGLDRAERLQHRTLEDAAHVFAASQWTADSLVSDCGVPRERVTVVYTGGGLSIPRGVVEHRMEREILFVGFDWERKGGPLLYDAFRIVHDRFPDATLRIIGCDPELDHPGIRVEGRLDKRNPAEYERLVRCYLRASCMCLPTLFDPFPNAIVEAGSVGLATVAIDNGSRREIILNGKTGILAASAEPEAVASALCELLENPKRCKQMGENARAHVSANFTWEKAVDQIGQIVRKGTCEAAGTQHTGESA